MRNLICLFFVVFTPTLHSQWSTDPFVNNPICTEVNTQDQPDICTDGVGGAIIAWKDQRAGLDDIYAQRIDWQGNRVWQLNGIPVCDVDYSQRQVQVVPDGLGGAILVWTDDRNGTSNPDIYAQKIGADGSALWDLDGILVCGAVEGQGDPRLVADGQGGAIVVWVDGRVVGDPDLYAQRVSSAGVSLWAPNGIPVTTLDRDEDEISAIGDGVGGAFVIWTDDRTVQLPKVYAQHIDSSGNLVWAVDGLLVADNGGFQWAPYLEADNEGGMLVAWQQSNATCVGINAQRLDSGGNIMWDQTGVDICCISGNHRRPKVVGTGGGGAIVVWDDSRAGQEWTVYSQTVDPGGNPVFPNGFPLGVAVAGQFLPTLVTDDDGGAIVSWWDERGTYSPDIHAQRVSSKGFVWWDPGSVPISTAMSEQVETVMEADGSGGTIIAWVDGRNFSQTGGYDIYAQRVGADGLLGGTTDVDQIADPIPLEFTLSQNYPNPFNPSTTMSFSIQNRAEVSLKIFNFLGEEVATLVSGNRDAGTHTVQWDATGQPSGVYFCRLLTTDFVQTEKLVLVR